jgi:3,4-dihydroxy-2-butanone 4-phosphate synthase
MDDSLDQVIYTSVVSKTKLTKNSGFICASLPPKRLSELSLPPLLPPSGTSQDPKGTAYHLTVDASSVKSHPVTTGISAHDRAYTARLLAGSDTVEDDLTRPGHMVTLRYTPGGVRRRRGHTECAVGKYTSGCPKCRD